MNNNRDISPLFGLWFLLIIGWQLIEMKRLVDAGGDWTGDGLVTISDYWAAYQMAWSWPARQLVIAMPANAIQFLELNIFDLSWWFAFPVSFCAWTLVFFVPCVALTAVVEMLAALLQKKKL